MLFNVENYNKLSCLITISALQILNDVEKSSVATS